jgi:hypothetical protein
VYLAEDVDEESRADNEARIRELEAALYHNEALVGWQQHDISRLIAKQARESYVEFAQQLAGNRSLTDAERTKLWGKQDACLFLLSLIETDAKGALEELQREVKNKLAAF